MRKYIGYILLSWIILVLACVLVFLLLQSDGGAVGKSVTATPTDVSVTVHNLDEIFDDFSLGIDKHGGVLFTDNTGVRNLYHLNRLLPVTRLSQTNHDLVYAVYDVAQNGIGYSMYVFFQRGEDYEGDNAGQITEDSFLKSPEKWPITGQVLFMNKTLTFADFSSLQIGDSVEKAAEIDPIVHIAKEEKDSSAIYFHTRHLLADGSLLLVFNRESTDEEFSLASIEFHENFIFDGINGKQALCIRPEDYANK